MRAARPHWGPHCATTNKSGCRSDSKLLSPQVVCATCTGAGDSMLAERIFRVVVIDEATQATEPAVLVPLTRGAQCVVMAGDPKQLPPTIVSPQAFDFALDVTLFDRISENGVMPLLLDTQVGMPEGCSAQAARALLAGGVFHPEVPLVPPIVCHHQCPGIKYLYQTQMWLHWYSPS